MSDTPEIDLDAVEPDENEYPIAVSQYVMSRIMAEVELPGVYGHSIAKTIRAISACHTDSGAQEIRLGERKLRRLTGHSTRTLSKHMWTLIDDFGLLRRVPETGTIKAGELRVYWGTDRWDSRGRERPIPGIAPRTPPPVNYPPLFPGLYRKPNSDGGKPRNKKPRTKNREKSNALVLSDARFTPVLVHVATVLSARLGLPAPLHGEHPRVIDPVWDGHPLAGVRPAWLRVLTLLFGGESRVLSPRDRRIARTMAALPIPLVTVSRNSITTMEGRRKITRIRLVWRRRAVTRTDLDQILASLPDQGAAVKARAARARTFRGHPHVAQTRRLIPIFAKLAQGAPKRRRLRAQGRRAQARDALVVAKIREDGLRLLAPLIARERARTLPIRPPEAPDVNDIVPLSELRAFRAKHRVTEDDERLEEFRYLRSQVDFDRHWNDPEPEPLPDPDRNEGGEAALKRLGLTE